MSIPHKSIFTISHPTLDNGTRQNYLVIWEIICYYACTLKCPGLFLGNFLSIHMKICILNLVVQLLMVFAEYSFFFLYKTAVIRQYIDSF